MTEQVIMSDDDKQKRNRAVSRAHGRAKAALAKENEERYQELYKNFVTEELEALGQPTEVRRGRPRIDS